MKHRFLFASLFCAVSTLFLNKYTLFAQSADGCGTEEHLHFLKKTGQLPVDFFEPVSPIGGKKGSPAPISQPLAVPKRCGKEPVIPVVVHIFHLGEAVGTGSNLSDATIIAGIQNINNRWGNTNGLGVPLGIRFELARRDPMGNPTTGINRINASAVPGYAANGTSFNGSAGPQDVTLKDLSKWPITDYYNIWIVHTINGFPAGYAFYPGTGTGNQYDGTIVRAGNFAGGSVMTHELGHAFNLAHTFEGDDTGCPPDADCTTDGDGVCDTPPHKQADCGATNPCSATGIWDNSRFNYMSYCGGTNRFTAGQKVRVTDALYQSVRQYLLESKGLIPVNEPNELAIEEIVFPKLISCTPSFKPILKIKNNGTATANSFDYDLFLDGALLGNFTQNTVAIPAGQSLDVELTAITAGPGAHDFEVALTGINGGGPDLYLYDNSICGFFAQKSQSTADLCHDHEGHTLATAMTYSDTASIYPVQLPGSLFCATVQNEAMLLDGSASDAEAVEFVLGPIDLAGLPDPILSFDVARQQPFSNCNEYATLTITASADCGKTSTVLFEKNDAPIFPCFGNQYPNTPERLNTAYGAANGVFFVPQNCGEWRREALDLSAFTGQTVTVRFSATWLRPRSLSNVLYFDNFCLNKCAAPTAPFALQPMPDTVRVCLFGDTTLTLSTNQANDNNVAYLWHEAPALTGPWSILSTSKSATAQGFAVGTKYLRGISNKNGCADTLNIVFVTAPQVTLTADPANATACFGETITLTGTASVAGLTPIYQWESGPTGTGPWTAIAGANAASYSFEPPVGTVYYHLVAGAAEAGCNSDFSFPASVKTDATVEITAQPTDLTECVGGNDKFTITATGTGAIKYQWQRAPALTGPWTNFGPNQPTAGPAAATPGTFFVRVIVSSANGYCTDTSIVVTQTVVTDPIFSQQPVGAVGCVGQAITLTGAATGGTGTFSYQWATAPDFLSPFTPIPGATDPSYSPVNGAGINYYQLIVTQSGTGCNVLTSNAVSLALDDPAVVTLDPPNIAECTGGQLPMNAAVSGTGFIQIQWQSAPAATGPWTNYSNFSADFTPPSVVIGTKFYRVIVRSEFGYCKDTSAVAAAEIVAAPSISAQPESFSGCSSGLIPLTVTAAGGFPPLQYEWQSSGSAAGPFSPITNSNSATYNAPDLPGPIFYQVVVSTAAAGCPTVISQPAEVTSGGQVMVANDPKDITECLGGTKKLTVPVVTNGVQVDYFWLTSNSPTGPFTFAAAPNSGTWTPPSIALGTIYYKVIVQSTTGDCADTSAVAAVNIVENAVITDQPDDKADCSGNPATLVVAATGGIGPLTYQWQNAANALGPFTDIPGATATSLFVPNQQGGNFYQVVINSAAGSGCPAVVSDVATVSFDAPFNIVEQPKPINECIGGLDQLSVTTGGSGGLGYQWQSAPAQNGPWADVTGATTADFTPSSAVAGTNFFRLVLVSPDGFCHDTTEVVEVKIEPQITFLTQPIGYNGCEGVTKPLSVQISGGTAPVGFQWQETPAGNIPFTDILGQNGPTFLPPVMAGFHYYRVIINSPGAGCNSSISGVAIVAVDPVVSATMTSPTDLSECVGGIQSFNAVSTGGGATYQWQSAAAANGTFSDVPGATTLGFTPPATAVGQIFYRLILRSINGFCMDTSAVQSMTVAADLAISPQPQNYEACVGGNLTLVSGATGGISPTFQWQSSASAAGPWANVPGATTVNFSPPLNAGGTIFYQMIASSSGAGCQPATSAAAQVLLHPEVKISAQPQSIFECFGGNQALSATATGGTALVYQWQVQLPNGSWSNISGANAANFTPPADVNFSQKKYRLVVSDTNLACGSDTSAVANVAVQTNFSVKNALDACNFGSGSQPAVVDFNAQVTAGDPTPVWQSIDAPAPPGPWTAKDFTGWPSGQTFRFMATMDDNVAPCKAVSDTIFVKILDCCPIVCTDPPTASLCNSATQPFDLGTLECAGIAPGSWILTAGPGISGQTPLPNGLFDPAGKAEGSYTVIYQLTGNVPPVCAASSSEMLNIIETPDAGTAGTAPVFCENQPQTVGLAGLLTGEDLGGIWADISQNPATGGLFNAASGTLNLAGLAPGNYLFEYKINGVAGCPGDAATVALTLGNTPTAIAGADALLTCDNPKTDLGSPLNGADGATIFWEETAHNGFIADPTAAVLTTTEPGFYEITATDPATGCTASDAVEVLASQNFITDVEILTDDPSCNGLADGQIEVASVAGGSPPLTFTLNGGAAGAESKFTKLAPGIFKILVTDKDGCSTERTVALADPLPLTVTLPGDTQIFCGDSVFLKPEIAGGTGPVTWLWFAGTSQLPIGSDIDFWAKPEKSAVFLIKIMDENGCPAEAATKISVEENLPVFAPTAFMPGSSANGVFRLFAHEKVEKVVSFRVFDRLGNLVFEQKNKSFDDTDFGWDGTFRGKDLPPAVFVFMAELDLCDHRRVLFKGSVTLTR